MRVMQAAQKFDDDVAHNMTTVAELRPRVVGMTEMAIGPNDEVRLNTARRILGPAGYTVFTAEDGGPHCREVPLAIRLVEGDVVDYVRGVQLNPVVDGGGLGNDRHLLTVGLHNTKSGRKRAHAQTHWVAGIQGPHGNIINNARAVAAAKGSQIMERELKAVLSEGRDLTTHGDFNWRLHDNDPLFHGWVRSPVAMFKRLDLTYSTTGLDWLAWSDTLHLEAPPVVIEPGHGGNVSDHPWSIARLVPKVTR